MNAPVKAAVSVRALDFRDADEVRRIEGFVAENGGSLFHRPAWLRAVEAGTGQRAAGLVAERMGTVTGWLLPLMLSVPATSSLPASTCLTPVDMKVAFGNFRVSNQSGLSNSASVSAVPMEALPRSIVKLIFDAATCFGSNAICASNWRNLPSTGTPICRVTKAISLCAGTSFCWACVGKAANSAVSDSVQQRMGKRILGCSRK